MSNLSYDIQQIHEAISDPKGDRAVAVGCHGWGIDAILDDCKKYLSENQFVQAEDIIEKLREYVKRNLGKKFKTMGYARKLVSNLEVIVKAIEDGDTWRNKRK